MKLKVDFIQQRGYLLALTNLPAKPPLQFLNRTLLIISLIDDLLSQFPPTPQGEYNSTGSALFSAPAILGAPFPVTGNSEISPPLSPLIS